MLSEDYHDDWTQLWNARIAALERVLGKSSDEVLHGITPFEFGFEMGGTADIVLFHHHIDGISYVTSELIGCSDQMPNEVGNYELMICHHKGNEWGPKVIGQLAHYTLDAELNSGDTMDISSAVPHGSTISGFLFDEYATFEVLGMKAGLMLCLGITRAELAQCRTSGSIGVIQKLKSTGVYPYTDLNRTSVI